MDMKYEGTRSLARPRRCPLRVPLRPPPILPSLVRSNHNPSPPSERATADVSLLPRSPLESADPSSGDVPIELIEEALQHGKATCVAFNRRGTLLAAGTAAGSVQVWDFQTRSVARELVSDSAEESAAILSVAWSRDGRKLMSSAADGSLTVWDVAEADDVFRHTFDAPLHRAQFNPNNPSLALVCPSDDGPMTFALGRGRKRTPLPQMPGGIDVPSLVCRIPSAGLDTSATRAPAHALYSKSGAHVFVGNVRGVVTVVETATLDIVQACKVPDAALIKRMELSADGRRLLVVSSAKAMHAYDVDERRRDDADAKVSGVSAARAVLTPAGSFANHASRGQWSAGAFTRDGERVLGASAGGAHELHVWRRADGVVERVASGAAEAKGIAQLEAHPTRPMCVALGSNGVMYAWSKSHDECWSAFAPDFVELTENEEYVEREDEFDATKRDPEDPSGNVAKAIAAPNVVARGAAVEAARSVAEAEEAVRAELEALDKVEREEAERAGREGEDANPATPGDAPPATAPAPPESALASAPAALAPAASAPAESAPAALAPAALAPEALAPEALAPEASALEAAAEKKGERPDTAVVVAEPTDEERALVAAAAEEAAKAAAKEKAREEYRQFVILSHEQVSALAEKLRGARSEAAAAAAAAAEAASLEKSAAIAAAARECDARRAEEEAAAERAAATAEDGDVDVLTVEPGYLTEEEAGEDCMHHLPLELEPDPRAAEIVQTRVDRWAKRAERAAAQETGEPDAAGGEKRKRESDEGEDDEEEDGKEEEEENDDDAEENDEEEEANVAMEDDDNVDVDDDKQDVTMEDAA